MYIYIHRDTQDHFSSNTPYLQVLCEFQGFPAVSQTEFRSWWYNQFLQEKTNVEIKGSDDKRPSQCDVLNCLCFTECETKQNTS